MELKICGTEQELAEFLKALGTAKVITKAVVDKPKVVAKNAPTKIPKGYVDTIALTKKYNLSGQAIRNYTRKGMPFIKIESKVGGSPKFMYNPSEVDEWITQYQKDHISKNRGTKYPRKIKVVVTESEYTKWKAPLMESCRVASKDFGKSLNLVYKYMTKNYGIVWEQEKKDFKIDNGYYPKSTTQLAYWLEQTRPAYKNLVSSCLDTILKGEDKT